MGKVDTESKNYVNNADIFADVFNYFLYDGEDVIKPENLHPYDTTEIAVVYGNNSRKPIQKYRDSLKIWNVMSDGNCIYVLLGAEIQNKIHYAMLIKSGLYDFIDYADQVDKKSKEYHSKKNEADINVEEDVVKIKLTSDEFLSGFRKEDKLIPVITVVIYFGSEKWDGPLSLNSRVDVLTTPPNYNYYYLENGLKVLKNQGF